MKIGSPFTYIWDEYASNTIYVLHRDQLNCKIGPGLKVQTEFANINFWWFKLTHCLIVVTNTPYWLADNETMAYWILNYYIICIYWVLKKREVQTQTLGRDTQDKQFLKSTKRCQTLSFSSYWSLKSQFVLAVQILEQMSLKKLNQQEIAAIISICEKSLHPSVGTTLSFTVGSAAVQPRLLHPDSLVALMSNYLQIIFWYVYNTYTFLCIHAFFHLMFEGNTRSFRWKQYYGAHMDINLIIAVTNLLDFYIQQLAQLVAKSRDFDPWLIGLRSVV